MGSASPPAIPRFAPTTLCVFQGSHIDELQWQTQRRRCGGYIASANRVNMIGQQLGALRHTCGLSSSRDTRKGTQEDVYVLPAYSTASTLSTPVTLKPSWVMPGSAPRKTCRGQAQALEPIRERLRGRHPRTQHAAVQSVKPTLPFVGDQTVATPQYGPYLRNFPRIAPQAQWAVWLRPFNLKTRYGLAAATLGWHSDHSLLYYGGAVRKKKCLRDGRRIRRGR